MGRLQAATLCAWLATPAIAATDTESRIQRVTREIPPPVIVSGESPRVTPLTARMSDLRVPAVSIAVIHRGRIEWARGFGVTRREGPPVTDRTLFQAASISKPVFALAVVRLADTGKLDLQADIDEYLTSWKMPDGPFTRDDPVSLRALLSHSAGVTGQGFRGYDSNAPLPTLVQILEGAPPANSNPVRVDTAPGTRYRYSGGGYVVAQAVLQDVTGQPPAEFLRRFLLRPLGMRRSTFEQPLPAARAAEIALPHRADGSPVEGGPHVYPELAAAGLWSTPSDLARYALGVQAALRGERNAVISASAARTLLTPVLEDHGLGPRIGGRTARKFFTHNGGNEGYRCLLVAYEDGEGAVVMTNGDNGGVLMEEVMRSIAHVYGWPDFAPALRTIVGVEPERLARLAGAYRFADGTHYFVRRRDGRIEGQEPGHPPVELFTSGDHALFARGEDLVIEFDETAGSVSSLRHGLGDARRIAVRADESQSRELFAWMDRTEQRVREQVPDAGGDDEIRRLLAGIRAGAPDFRRLSPAVSDAIGQQLPALKSWLDWLGEMKGLEFQRVDAYGRDEYRGEFSNGPLRILIRLNREGRVESAEFAPG